jgi:hypothetical protein
MVIRYFNFPMQILRSFNPLQLQPLLKNKKIEGKVTHAELDTSTLQEYYDFLQKLQKDVHGMSLFDTNNRIRLLAYPEKFYVAYARDKCKRTPFICHHEHNFHYLML